VRRPEESPLALLQRRFFELVVGPAPRDADVERLMVGDQRASAVERLDVYANMYFFRILDVLRDHFPKLAAAVGDDAFRELGAAYLRAHPSTDPSLRNVGRAVPGFVRAHGATAGRPWLAELAALEWARLDVFDRADVGLLARERLAALPPDAFAHLALALVPAHEVVAARHAVEDTWRALEAGGALAPPREAPAGYALLVWRRGVDVYHRPLEPGEAEALALVRAGTTFGALCTLLGREREASEAAVLAVELLGRWLADELLAG